MTIKEVIGQKITTIYRWEKIENYGLDEAVTYLGLKKVFSC
jgi:hypothetical protein